MKLLVIVLCLLSERFLVHVTSHNRFFWFSRYAKVMENILPKGASKSSPWLILLCICLPIVLASFIVLYLFGNLLFGLIGLVLNLIIFYYCLGPGNPFYPTRSETDKETEADVGNYLAQANGQLFAVAFWYIILGPLAVIIYRLVSLSQSQQTVKSQATWLTQLLDWIPTRMTSLLYLIVGNFQAGLRCFSKMVLSKPQDNQVMLNTCGLQSLGEQKPVTIRQAETLVEHALIALLVILACFTLIAWM
jgi:AmpE protein